MDLKLLQAGLERCPNFSREEVERLKECINKYEKIILCKKSDTVSTNLKEATWLKIERDFNAQGSVKRTIKQLKNKFDNIKRTARKDISQHRLALLGTGGGPPPPSLSDDTEWMYSKIPLSIDGHTPEYDDDVIAMPASEKPKLNNPIYIKMGSCAVPTQRTQEIPKVEFQASCSSSATKLNTPIYIKMGSVVRKTQHTDEGIQTPKRPTEASCSSTTAVAVFDTPREGQADGSNATVVLSDEKEPDSSGNQSMATPLKQRLNVLYERNWTRLVHEQLRKFETSIVTAARRAAPPAELGTDAQWSFTGALLYCLTLITTVGYGSVSPRTAAGRAATVAYAAAGVPLALACLAGLGAGLARASRAAWLRARRPPAPHTLTAAAWRKEHELDSPFQLRERRRLLQYDGGGGDGGGGGGGVAHNQYTALPPGAASPRAPPHPARHIVHVPDGGGGGDRAHYSQVFERAPHSPRAATLGRAPRGGVTAANDVRASPPLHAQTLGRGGAACQQRHLATVHAAQPRPAAPALRPRPLTPDVRQLMAEERVLSASPSAAAAAAAAAAAHSDLDDADDLDGDCVGEHGTPSRVPLIWKSTRESRPESGARAGAADGTSQEHARVPAALVLLLLGGYVCAGAAALSAWEGRSFLDAAYFCFVALATIGLGDGGGGDGGGSGGDASPLRAAACCAYLVLGLVLIACSFSLLQEEVGARCARLAAALGLARP